MMNYLMIGLGVLLFVVLVVAGRDWWHQRAERREAQRLLEKYRRSYPHIATYAKEIREAMGLDIGAEKHG